MDIEIRNIDKVLRKFDDLSNIDLMPIFINEGAKVQTKARELAPKDTGDLRASIKLDKLASNDGVSIHTNLEYAPYVEFGTRFMYARPYLGLALSLLSNTIDKDIEAYIKQEIAKKTK